MPKFSVPLSGKLHGYVREFSESTFLTDGTILLCKICEKTINHEKKYFISQHVSTAKHKSAAAKMIGQKKISLISTVDTSSNRQSQFSLELCKAFMEAGIPFWKVENKSLRKFLEKYTKETVPSESTLRKTYLSVCYEEALQRIRAEVGGKKIWISIDESTDAMGRYIANVIPGTMEPTCGESSSFLLT